MEMTYGQVLKAYFSEKSKKTNSNLTNFFIFEILSLKEQQLFKRFAIFGTLGNYLHIHSHNYRYLVTCTHFNKHTISSILCSQTNTNLAIKNTLNGHTNIVSALAVLHNGDLASGSYDDTIKIWNSFDGIEKMTISGFLSWHSSLLVLQNGDLAYGLRDNTIKILNSIDGTLKMTLFGHSNDVVCLALLHNGDLASGSYSKLLQHTSDFILGNKGATNFIFNSSKKEDFLFNLCNKLNKTIVYLLRAP
ncbi:high-affnity carbon uptake Hat [Brachionus plicatilis]|uniref:High-affnity carbon uptake Hat n=1 Tax=Brachionus plicatilis TaxID=10195 RepID=A0A3M7STB5_BRAPC|nr:high-affnity carbon uptake Hat [Brachionus plicatilis]